MTGSVILGSIARNSRETVRVSLEVFRGQPLLQVRTCVELTKASGVLVPTAKGIALVPVHIAELRRLLAEAEQKARALGWIGGDA